MARETVQALIANPLRWLLVQRDIFRIREYPRHKRQTSTPMPPSQTARSTRDTVMNEGFTLAERSIQAVPARGRLPAMVHAVRVGKRRVSLSGKSPSEPPGKGVAMSWLAARSGARTGMSSASLTAAVLPPVAGPARQECLLPEQ